MPQWIKAGDRLPSNGTHLRIKTKDGKHDAYYNKKKFIIAGNLYTPREVQWLDEDSNEQVFTLEDMRECHKVGVSLGENSFIGDGRGKHFDEFMKLKFNIYI